MYHHFDLKKFEIKWKKFMHYYIFILWFIDIDVYLKLLIKVLVIEKIILYYYIIIYVKFSN